VQQVCELVREKMELLFEDTFTDLLQNRQVYYLELFRLVGTPHLTDVAGFVIGFLNYIVQRACELAREKLELLFEDTFSDLLQNRQVYYLELFRLVGTLTDVAGFVIGFLCPLYANCLCSICIWNVASHSNYPQRYNDKCLISRVTVFTPEL
jgi:hypothetical protein